VHASSILNQRPSAQQAQWVRLVQNPWLGFAWNWTDTLIVLGITVGAALISLRFFRWESRNR
jgi:hypothetical protein